MRAFLDSTPAFPRKFWRRIAGRIGNETTVCLGSWLTHGFVTKEVVGTSKPYVNGSVIVFDVTQQLESTQLPFTAFRCVYGSYSNAAVYGRGFVIDELEGPLKAMIDHHQY